MGSWSKLVSNIGIKKEREGRMGLKGKGGDGRRGGPRALLLSIFYLMGASAFTIALSVKKEGEEK